MPEVHETQLPGVGVRHDFGTHEGRRIGVITHVSGRRDLLIYSDDDPDACAQTLHLDDQEAHALADVLGGSQVSRHVEEVAQSVDGVTIDWLHLTGSWPCAGRTLREIPLREKTGVMVVSVVREGESIAMPGPDFELHADDTVVVVGTAEGVAAAGAMLRGS